MRECRLRRSTGGVDNPCPGGAGLTHPTLILTRPEDQSRRFAAAARRAGIGGAILFSPVLRIVPRPLGGRPGGDLVFTSIHGVAAAGDLRGCRSWVVGGATARAAERAGSCIRGVAPDVAALAAALLAARPERITHLRGVHAAGTLAADLAAAGIAVESRVVYDQVAQAPGPAAARAIATRAVLLPLFSPRSAALVGGALEAPPAAARLLAISAACARAWPWPGEVAVAARPDAAAMLDGLRGLVAREGDR